LLAILLVVAASYAILHLFLYLNDAGAETIIERVTEARSYLPAIVQEERDLVMMFGSSMTDAGFAARQFDREMEERGIEVKSFNFGFGGLNPYFQVYLSRRVRDAFQAGGRRLKLALIEFAPLQNTRARWQGAQPVIDSYVAMLADGGDIRDVVRDDFTRGVRVAQIKYLRNEISAEMATWYFGSLMFDARGRPDAGFPADEEKDKVLREVGEKLSEAFQAEYPDYDGCDWCWDWQGAGTIPSERSPETLDLFVEYYDALRSEQRLADDRAWRIECCDIEELDFEEALVAAFIRTVENFKDFADDVEVILLPRNQRWIGRSPEAEQRLNDVLERIRRETGVSVRSFEDAGEITPGMFSDTTHLARYSGDVAFTHLLVETYAPSLSP
jgi:hypothetical protein